MNINLRSPDQHDLDVLLEHGTTPMFFADSCAIDQAAVELRIGGTVVAGLFEPLTEFENAWALVEDVCLEMPENRILDVAREGWDQSTLDFYTPEENAAVYSEEELEWEAYSALAALAILRSRQEASVAPEPALKLKYIAADVTGSQNGTQRSWDDFEKRDPFKAVPHDWMSQPRLGEPTFLEPVGVMSHEEVAAAFDKHVTGAAA